MEKVRETVIESLRTTKIRDKEKPTIEWETSGAKKKKTAYLRERQE